MCVGENGDHELGVPHETWDCRELGVITYSYMVMVRIDSPYLLCGWN